MTIIFLEYKNELGHFLDLQDELLNELIQNVTFLRWIHSAKKVGVYTAV